MKIIFDRSAFNNRFDLLRRSRLLQLTEDGELTVYHTATFVDETLRMANSTRPERREELIRQWPFLVSICNGGWFKPLLIGQPPLLRSVCDEELDDVDRGGNWTLVSDNVRRHCETTIIQFLNGDTSLPELVDAQPVYTHNREMRALNQTLRVRLRRQSALRQVPFSEYLHANLSEAGSLLIRRPQLDGIPPLPLLDHAERKFEAWRQAPERFPHFTAFVAFWIYSLYDAESNQNSRLDQNWQPDAKQLCFLVDVDAIVSCDLGFMKKAFDCLWRPSQKRFFTPEEFVGSL